MASSPFIKSILKRVEIVLRHSIVYPLMRLCLRNPVKNEKVDLQSIKKLLILRDDGIGDMIVSTPIFRKLKEANPGLIVAVFASRRNAPIIRDNPFIDELFIAYSSLLKLWSELRRCKILGFDVVVNFVFNHTTSEGLLANYVAPRAHKVGQGRAKYQMYFNRLLRLERNEKHMVEILARIIDEIFGTNIESQPLSPEIFIPDPVHAKVDAFLRDHGLRRRPLEKAPGTYCVINFSAVDVIRRMSEEQAVEIITAINGWGNDSPIIICPPGEDKKLKRILSRLDYGAAKTYPPSGVATLLELASLINGARYAVTCDTSIVHFAAAVKTPVFVLFTPTAAFNHEWKPYGVRNKCLFAQQGFGVDSIPTEQIVNELSAFQE